MAVLFVCTGNFCRSPVAHGVFQQLVDAAGIGAHVRIDSAGTHAYQPGEPPDVAAIESAGAQGYQIEQLQGRQFELADFDNFDQILVMDHLNYDHLLLMCPDGRLHKLDYLLAYAPELGIREIPDPFRGPRHEYEQMVDLVSTAARGLLRSVRRRLEV